MSRISQCLFAASLLAIATVAHGAQPSPEKMEAPMKRAPVIDCVSPIPIKNLSFAGQPVVPDGWNAEFSSYSQMPVKVVNHRVTRRGKLVCVYATNGDRDALKLLQLQRSPPKGMRCSAISKFKFKCQRK